MKPARSLDRQIYLEDQPRPFVTPQAVVTQVMGARAACPTQALRDAEDLRRRCDLRSDRLEGLRDARRITASELRAGSEMLMVVEWEAGAMQPMARSQFRERLVSSAYEGDGQLWLVLTEIEHTRYLPWLEWARTVQVARAADATMAALVREIVVEGRGLRRVESDLGMRNGRALSWLRAGLHRYASIAGWQVGAEPPIETD